MIDTDSVARSHAILET